MRSGNAKGGSHSLELDGVISSRLKEEIVQVLHEVGLEKMTVRKNID
jgi:hypothetical protein